MTFSKRLGFLESGYDVDNMMHYTGQAMDYIGMVSVCHLRRHMHYLTST
jgi:hypothetical protein